MAKSIEVVSALSYYNIIADKYNSLMTGESDRHVREAVSKVFKKTVHHGNILDFGGGTGLDLPWLIEHKMYKIFFLEPSAGMRAVAEESIPEMENVNTLIFVKEATDISKWSDKQLPFNEQMEGVLANFAVLNCIKNIRELFDKIALICNKGCVVLATVLDSRRWKIIKRYPIKTKLSAIFTTNAVIYNRYNGTGHATYLHTKQQFKEAAGAYFTFDSYEPIGSSNFALLKLRKK